MTISTPAYNSDADATSTTAKRSRRTRWIIGAACIASIAFAGVAV